MALQISWWSSVEICKKCGGIAEWNSYYGGVICTRCGHVEKPKRTHYDSIREMGIETMAKAISHIAGCPLNVFYESPMGRCVKNCRASVCWLEWLKQEDKETESE